MFLLFLAPDLSPGWRGVHSYASFIFFCTAISLVNIPNGALTSVLASDSRERSGLSAYRRSLVLAGTLVAARVTKPLVGRAAWKIRGFRLVGAVYGVLAAGVTLVTFFSLRERMGEASGAGGQARVGLSTTLRVLRINTPFLLPIGGLFAFMIATGMMAGAVNYDFRYNLQSEGLMPVAFLSLFVTAILFIPLFVWISNRTSIRFAFALGIRLLISLFPMCLVVLGVVAISFYSLTAEKHRQVLQEIQ